MRLELKNTTDRKIILATDVTDSEASRLYYTIDVNLPEGLPNGEYEYKLTDDTGILSTGLVIIGGYVGNRKEYERTITYKQYGAK